MNCISLEGLSGSHALRTKNILRVLRFGAFTFSEQRTCIVLSMFVSPAIHLSYEFGRIAYHQYVNIYAVQKLYDSWTIASRLVRVVRVVRVVSSHSRVVCVRQYWTRMEVTCECKKTFCSFKPSSKKVQAEYKTKKRTKNTPGWKCFPELAFMLAFPCVMK